MERIMIIMQRPGDGAEVRATIEPDGEIRLHVVGGERTDCRALTADLETDLGAVKARRFDPKLSRQEQEQIIRQTGGRMCG